MSHDTPSLAELQKQFSNHLLNKVEADAVTGLVALSSARLSVYRNNVKVSLVDVIGQAFPKTREVAGPDNFDYTASEFVLAHPPEEACLSRYGQAFPDFLEQFMPDAAPAFLPDLARLEWLRTESYFAQTTTPLTAEQFQTRLSTLSLTEYEGLGLKLSDTIRVLRSPYLLFEIWQDAAHLTANRIAALSSLKHVPEGDTSDNGATGIPQTDRGFLVARASKPSSTTESDTVWHTEIGQAELTLLERLLSGHSLQNASGDLLRLDPSFDLQAFLGFLLGENLIIDITISSGETS